MPRKLTLAFFLCFAAMTGFAQSPLSGKWATARSAEPMAATDAQRRHSVQLEVTISNPKTEISDGTATATCGGSFLSIACPM